MHTLEFSLAPDHYFTLWIRRPASAGGTCQVMKMLSRPDPTPAAVAELFEHVSRLVHSLSFSAGLNPAQWAALRFLSRATPNASTMSAFAAFHRTTKSTASQTLAALARKKLIRKLRDGRDGRVFRICVTAKGQLLLRHDPVNVLVEALSELSARERRGIAAAIGRMAQILATRARRTR